MAAAWVMVQEKKTMYFFHAPPENTHTACGGQLTGDHSTSREGWES